MAETLFEVLSSRSLADASGVTQYVEIVAAAGVTPTSRTRTRTW